MTTETIDGEIVDDERHVIPFVPPPTVALAVSVDEALEQWKDYQRLTRELLDDTDYQQIGNKKFKKKSAWRKYARAFNITDRVTFEDIKRDERGFPVWARIRVEARATNGRTAEADHECHITERCCPAATGDYCRMADWDKHTCCRENCNGKLHWSHPGDLPATALTRAKNRAISDLIGAGEVSAEEMTEKSAAERPAFRPPPRDEFTAPPTPERTADGVRPPRCKTHDVPMKFYKAGVAKASGKPYPAFWKCFVKDCKVSVNDDAWRSQLLSDEQPREEVDHDDIPFSE